MKAIILARSPGAAPLSLIEIGGQPLLWHIVRRYAAYGIQQFVIACGSTPWVKQAIAHCVLNMRPGHALPSQVSLVATEDGATTGEQLRHLRPEIGHEAFCLSNDTHLSSVNIHDLIRHHQRQGTLMTKIVTPSPAEPGERPSTAADGDGWSSSGSFVMEPAALDAICSDAAHDQEVFQGLARKGQISAYRHTGFARSVSTLQDRDALETLWNSGQAPWKIWLS
jgi:glucose-1-phosphate cytidylyltransferase